MKKVITINDEIIVTVTSDKESQELDELIKYINQFSLDREVIAIKDRNGYQFLNQDDINSVEVYKDELTINTDVESYVIKGRLYVMLEQLNTNNFIQVSKSAIININYLKRLENYFSGTMIAALKDGTKISVSRSFVNELKRKLDI